MYDRILVPTDGSEGAEAAAAHAIGIARRVGAAIEVLSVVDQRMFAADLADLDSAVDARIESLEASAQEWIDTVVALAEDGGVPVATAVERGIPAEAVLAHAADRDCDAIAMGTHGRTGLDRMLLGSVAERVVRSADRPVLVVRAEAAGSPDHDYGDVLIPTDGSTGARGATDAALDLAAAYDATVHALYVVDMRGYSEGDVFADLVSASRDEGERATGAIADRAADRGLAAEAAVRRGIPHLEILDYVDEAGVDLVSMGTHGRTGFRRAIIGSVTERVLRNCPVPLLAVRAGRTGAE